MFVVVGHRPPVLNLNFKTILLMVYPHSCSSHRCVVAPKKEEKKGFYCTFSSQKNIIIVIKWHGTGSCLMLVVGTHIWIKERQSEKKGKRTKDTQTFIINSWKHTQRQHEWERKKDKYFFTNFYTVLTVLCVCATLTLYACTSSGYCITNVNIFYGDTRVRVKCLCSFFSSFEM